MAGTTSGLLQIRETCNETFNPAESGAEVRISELAAERGINLRDLAFFSEGDLADYV